MTMTIYKYAVTNVEKPRLRVRGSSDEYRSDVQLAISMPVGAQVLSVQMQHGEAQLWALVDPKSPERLRKFRVVGTGHPIEGDPGVFIDTFQMNQGDLVFHVFEVE